MKTKITKYAHDDPEMFRLLGKYFCSRSVHKELGGPIYSGEGTTWFVAMEGENVIGFCSLRDAGSDLWFDYDYVEPDYRGKGVFTALAGARAKDAKALRKPIRICVLEERWQKHYPQRGWTVKSRRGRWIYGQKSEP